MQGQAETNPGSSLQRARSSARYLLVARSHGRAREGDALLPPIDCCEVIRSERAKKCDRLNSVPLQALLPSMHSVLLPMLLKAGHCNQMPAYIRYNTTQFTDHGRIDPRVQNGAGLQGSSFVGALRRSRASANLTYSPKQATPVKAGHALRDRQREAATSATCAGARQQHRTRAVSAGPACRNQPRSRKELPSNSGAGQVNLPKHASHLHRSTSRHAQAEHASLRRPSSHGMRSRSTSSAVLPAARSPAESKQAGIPLGEQSGSGCADEGARKTPSYAALHGRENAENSADLANQSAGGSNLEAGSGHKHARFSPSCWADSSSAATRTPGVHASAGFTAASSALTRRGHPEVLSLQRSGTSPCCGLSPSNYLLGSPRAHSDSPCRSQSRSRAPSPEGVGGAQPVQGQRAGREDWCACTAPLRHDPSSLQPVVALSKWDEALTR